MSQAGPTPHARPFYCPYCGEEDFAPFGETLGQYHCESCDRHFVVRFLGVGGRTKNSESEDNKDAV